MSNRLPVMTRPQARAGAPAAQGEVRRFWNVRALSPTGGGMGSAEIDIFGVIGEDFDCYTGQTVGVSAETFLAEVRALGPVAGLTLNINSPGGDAFDGNAIHAMLRDMPCRKVANIFGLCASAASIIAVGCDEIRMAANALLMIHDPSTFAAGTAADLSAAQAMLTSLKASMVTAYASKNKGMSPEAIGEVMTAATWYTAEEAKAAGWCDTIVEPVSATAFHGLDLKRLKGVPEALAKAVAEAPEPVVVPDADAVEAAAAAAIAAAVEEAAAAVAAAEPEAAIVPAVVETPAVVSAEAVASLVTEMAENLRGELAAMVEGLRSTIVAATAQASVVPPVVAAAAVVEPVEPVEATAAQIDAASRSEIRARAEEAGLLSFHDSWLKTGATTAELRAVVANAVAARQVHVSGVPGKQPETELPAAPTAQLDKSWAQSWVQSLNQATGA